MAGVDQTLILQDVSLQDDVVAVLEALHLPATAWEVEPATDFIGQQLAVDLYASSDEAMTDLVALVQTAISDKLSVSAPTPGQYAEPAA